VAGGGGRRRAASVRLCAEPYCHAFPLSSLLIPTAAAAAQGGNSIKAMIDKLQLPDEPLQDEPSLL
jgi:hypothetical protein